MAKMNMFVLVDVSGLVLGVRADLNKAWDYVDGRAGKCLVHLQKLTQDQIEAHHRAEAGRCFAGLAS